MCRAEGMQAQEDVALPVLLAVPRLLQVPEDLRQLRGVGAALLTQVLASSVPAALAPSMQWADMNRNE